MVFLILLFVLFLTLQLIGTICHELGHKFSSKGIFPYENYKIMLFPPRYGPPKGDNFLINHPEYNLIAQVRDKKIPYEEARKIISSGFYCGFIARFVGFCGVFLSLYIFGFDKIYLKISFLMMVLVSVNDFYSNYLPKYNKKHLNYIFEQIKIRNYSVLSQEKLSDGSWIYILDKIHMLL